MYNLSEMVFEPNKRFRMEDTSEIALNFYQKRLLVEYVHELQVANNMGQKIVISNATLHRYENAVVNFVIGGGNSLQNKKGKLFQNLVHALTNGYRPPTMQTILRWKNGTSLKQSKCFNIADNWCLVQLEFERFSFPWRHNGVTSICWGYKVYCSPYVSCDEWQWVICDNYCWAQFYN